MSEILYVVDKLFTRNRLHLIFGPPRSGKSTLQAQIEWDWCNGREVFSQKSFPANFCHIDALRPLAEVKAHFLDIGADPAQIPTISLLEAVSNEERTIDAVFSHAERLVHSCRVIFLDGLQSLCHGNITYQRDVVNFMAYAAQQCIKRSITIIATASTSKAAEAAGTTPVFQRITGSTAWVELAGTLTHIGPPSPSSRVTDPERTVTISMPRRKPLELSYTFTDDGRLECTGEAATFPEMDKWLVQISPGSDITSRDIVDAADARGGSRATAYRWLKEQVALGSMVLVEKGIYRKPAAPPIPN